MLLKIKRFRSCFIVMLVTIIVTAFINNDLSAQNQSQNPTVTIKLKVLSESLDADDITEVRKLIEAGADVNVINKYGATPIYIASWKGFIDIVKLLLEARADVNKAIKGVTPLFIASQEGHNEVVKLLLEAKANVNKARISNGVTPLWKASWKGHTKVVKLLLEAGADVNKATTDGLNPLHIAFRSSNIEVVRILKEHEAKHSLPIKPLITELTEPQAENNDWQFVSEETDTSSGKWNSRKKYRREDGLIMVEYTGQLDYDLRKVISRKMYIWEDESKMIEEEYFDSENNLHHARAWLTPSGTVEMRTDTNY